jgi:hypothetical protein
MVRNESAKRVLWYLLAQLVNVWISSKLRFSYCKNKQIDCNQIIPLTPWNRVLFEKLTVTQRVKKFLPWYSTCTTMFISTFKRATSPRSCVIFRNILTLYDAWLSPTSNGYEPKLNSFDKFDINQIVIFVLWVVFIYLIIVYITMLPVAWTL